MIEAVFTPGKNVLKVKGLFQYDYNQYMVIKGLELPSVCRVDFSNEEREGQAKRQDCVTEDGVSKAMIPNYLLWDEEQTEDYNIYAFVYVDDNNEGETVRKVIMPVVARPKPTDIDIPIDRPVFSDTIEAVKEHADTAIDAKNDAKRYAENADKALQELKDGIESGEFAGEDGVGISNAEQTVESDEPFGLNVFTITLTDGTVTEISVRNGKDGRVDYNEVENAIKGYLLKNPVTVETDKTLSAAGTAADAKSVGDKIKDVMESIPGKVSDLENDEGYLKEVTINENELNAMLEDVLV